MPLEDCASAVPNIRIKAAAAVSNLAKHLPNAIEGCALSHALQRRGKFILFTKTSVTLLPLLAGILRRRRGEITCDTVRRDIHTSGNLSGIAHGCRIGESKRRAVVFCVVFPCDLAAIDTAGDRYVLVARLAGSSEFCFNLGEVACHVALVPGD